jgi:hypothetical protein
MVRVDLNIVSVIGLILGAVAGVLVLVQYQAELDMRLGNYLGEGFPLAELPLPWVVLFLAVITYGVGRIMYLVKHRGGMPELPRRDEED